MRTRRGVLFGFSLTAGVLGLSTAAFACINFLGNMQVVGNGNPLSTSIVTGADYQGMWWVTPGSGCALKDPGVQAATGTAGSDVYTVTLSPDNTICPSQTRTNFLPGPATYSMSFWPGPMPGGGGGAKVHNCHTTDIPAGSISVDATGTSAATLTTVFVPTHKFPAGVYSLCVFNPVPVQIGAPAIAMNLNVA